MRRCAAPPHASYPTGGPRTGPWGHGPPWCDQSSAGSAGMLVEHGGCSCALTSTRFTSGGSVWRQTRQTPLLPSRHLRRWGKGWGSTAALASVMRRGEGHAQAQRQGVKVSVVCPQPCQGGEQRERQQHQVHRAAAQFAATRGCRTRCPASRCTEALPAQARLGGAKGRCAPGFTATSLPPATPARGRTRDGCWSRPPSPRCGPALRCAGR